jgi:histidine triad (HIT) family protein
VFCAIVAGRAPARVVDEDDATMAFLDINPIVEGHTLVVPKGHARDLHDCPPEALAATTVAAQRVARRLVDRLGADGVNLLHATGGAAWQTVFHLHLHVLPRRQGDLAFPFPSRGAPAGELDRVWRRVTGDGEGTGAATG